MDKQCDPGTICVVCFNTKAEARNCDGCLGNGGRHTWNTEPITLHLQYVTESKPEEES
jgi:hypothetical protein